jgi:hypothetical protein
MFENCDKIDLKESLFYSIYIRINFFEHPRTLNDRINLKELLISYGKNHLNYGN